MGDDLFLQVGALLEPSSAKVVFGTSLAAAPSTLKSSSAYSLGPRGPAGAAVTQHY